MDRLPDDIQSHNDLEQSSVRRHQTVCCDVRKHRRTFPHQRIPIINRLLAGLQIVARNVPVDGAPPCRKLDGTEGKIQLSASSGGLHLRCPVVDRPDGAGRFPRLGNVIVNWVDAIHRHSGRE